MDTHHQHTALILFQARHRTIRRLKLLNPAVGQSSGDAIAVTRLPEDSLTVDKDMTEKILIA